MNQFPFSPPHWQTVKNATAAEINGTASQELHIAVQKRGYKMNTKYERSSLIVNAQQYEPDKGMEDGFELYTKVVTNGWISPDHLLQFTRPDGAVVCPFIRNRRGIIFIREGDYIITEGDNERHVCGADKFSKRFTPVED